MTIRGGARRLRFRVLPSVLLTAAILFVPAMLYAWGRQADSFTIERITVVGSQRIPERQALKVLREEFLGRNLFTVTTKDVYATLADFCYLAAVEVDRDFPTTLRVRLVEHKPTLYVLARGRWFVVADSGHVICEAGAAVSPASSSGDAAATPRSARSTPPAEAGAAEAGSAAAPRTSTAVAETVVTAPARATGAVGEGGTGRSGGSAVPAALHAGPPLRKLTLPRMVVRAAPRVGVRTRDADIVAALRVLAALPSSLRARITVVRAGPGSRVGFDLADGPRVEFGDGARLAAKALALRAVLAAYRRGGVAPKLIDVSVPDRPLGQPALRS